MQSQQEKVDPSADKPSFLSVPEGVRNWAHVGARFWAGVLCGFSLGIFAAKCLVDLELLTDATQLLDHGARPGVAVDRHDDRDAFGPAQPAIGNR